MKTFTINDIKLMNPCYCPSRYLPTNWKGTALDILKMEKVEQPDQLWVVCRDGILSEKILRSFAVFCAAQVEHLMSDNSKASLEVMESYVENYFLIDDDSWRAAWELERVDAGKSASWDVTVNDYKDRGWVARAAWASTATDAGAAAYAASNSALVSSVNAYIQIKKLIEMIEETE